MEEERTVKRILPDQQVKENNMSNSIADSITKKTVFRSAMDEQMDAAQLELIPFVEKQIELVNNKLLFNGGTPTFEQLNDALAKHEGVLLGLTSLYEMAKWEENARKEEYDEWFAEKFIEVRTTVNSPEISASKWFSSKEIEYMVCAKYKDERAELVSKERLAESKRSTVERLIEGWKNYQFSLTTMSKNSQAEVQVTKDIDEDD